MFLHAFCSKFLRGSEPDENQTAKAGERNDNAGKVRDEPTGVANDLKDRVVGGFVHLVLVKVLPSCLRECSCRPGRGVCRCRPS